MFEFIAPTNTDMYLASDGGKADYNDMSEDEKIRMNMASGGFAWLVPQKSSKRSAEDITLQSGLEALDKQQAWGNEAIKRQQAMYQNIMALYQPYMDAGAQGVSLLENPAQTDALFESESRDFLKGLRRQQHARGRYQSSDTMQRGLTGLTGLAQDATNRNFQKALDLANMGQGSVERAGAAGNNMSNTVGSLYSSMGSQGSGILGQTGMSLQALAQNRAQQTGAMYDAAGGSVARLGQLAAMYGGGGR